MCGLVGGGVEGEACHVVSAGAGRGRIVGTTCAVKKCFNDTYTLSGKV